MRSLATITVATCSFQASEMLSLSYERLVRLSVFIAVARYDEMTSAHDRHHRTFERLFTRLEDDPAAGLYTLLCALSELVHPLAGNQSDAAALLDPDIVQQIRAIEVYRPPNHAQRHIRDYTVATSVLRVARRLATNMRYLAERYHRHHPPVSK